MNAHQRVSSKPPSRIPLAVWSLALATSLSLAACATSADPEVTPKPTSSVSQSAASPDAGATPTGTGETGQLTVKETKSPTAGAKVVLAKTEELNNMSVDIWLSDSLAIVSAENRNLPKFDNYTTGMVYPRSLYTYDIGSKEFTPLLEREGVHLWAMDLSPDNRHLIFSEYVVGDASLSILDIATEETSELTSTWGANWINDTTLIGQYYGENRAFTQKLGGERKNIKELEGKVGFILLVAGKDAYVSDPDGNLHRFDTATREIKTMGISSVIEIKESPDGTHLALTRFNEQDESELIVCDIDCSDPQIVAAAGGSFAWSPNNKMIAFADVEGSDTGAYVYDLSTGDTTQISVGTEFGKIAWSGSNETLSLATYGDDEQGLMTLLAHLSGDATQ